MTLGTTRRTGNERFTDADAPSGEWQPSPTAAAGNVVQRPFVRLAMSHLRRFLPVVPVLLLTAAPAVFTPPQAGPAEALADYVGGLRDGNAAQLLRVLHPAGQVCFQPGPTRPAAACEPFSSAAPRWTKTADPTAHGKVLQQHDATPNMSTITYELYVRDTHFIDQFVMYRIDGRWWIMGKTTEIVAPPP